jgi:putative DNA primase/helicase
MNAEEIDKLSPKQQLEYFEQLKQRLEEHARQNVKLEDGKSLCFEGWGEGGDYKRVFIPLKLAEVIQVHIPIKTLTPDETILTYNKEKGIYEEGQNTVEEIAQKIMTTDLNSHKLKETIGCIKRTTFTKRKDFEQKNIICLDNGVLDLTTKELKPFSPEFLFLEKIPLTYDKSADCPKIKKFLSEVLEPQDVSIIQEVIGYTLLKEYPYQKAIMLLGEGANEKSTLISLIKTFLGNDNVSFVSMQDLEENRFSAAQLHGKLANLFSDLPERTLQGTSKFKALTGGDEISVENKFSKPFSFTNYAKLIYSCNVLPEIKEDSDAVFRRWIILNFKKKFEGTNCNPNLLKEITTTEELSGLLNWALEGLDRLIQGNGFSFSLSTKEIRSYYLKLASPAKAFYEDRLIENPEGYIEKDELYSAFIAYCQERKLSTRSAEYFFKKLKEIHPYLQTERKEVLGIRKRCYIGLSFFDKEEKDLEIKEI